MIKLNGTEYEKREYCDYAVFYILRYGPVITALTRKATRE